MEKWGDDRDLYEKRVGLLITVCKGNWCIDGNGPVWGE